MLCSSGSARIISFHRWPPLRLLRDQTFYFWIWKLGIMFIRILIRNSYKNFPGYFFLYEFLVFSNFSYMIFLCFRNFIIRKIRCSEIYLQPKIVVNFSSIKLWKATHYTILRVVVWDKNYVMRRFTWLLLALFICIRDTCKRVEIKVLSGNNY